MSCRWKRSKPKWQKRGFWRKGAGGHTHTHGPGRENTNFARGDHVEVRGHKHTDRKRLSEATGTTNHHFLARLLPPVFFQYTYEIIGKFIRKNVACTRSHHARVKFALVDTAGVPNAVEMGQGVPQCLQQAVAFGRQRCQPGGRVQFVASRNQGLGLGRLVLATMVRLQGGTPRQKRPNGRDGRRRCRRIHGTNGFPVDRPLHRGLYIYGRRGTTYCHRPPSFLFPWTFLCTKVPLKAVPICSKAPVLGTVVLGFRTGRWPPTVW